MIAVGSDNANGTATTADDVVSTFSNDGDGTRNPDLVAPGEHVVSLRAPGSYLDTQLPGGPQSATGFFRGSGTSQATAVVSGAAALLIQQRPDITPDQVKALLMGTAQPIPAATARQQGAGLIDLATAMNTPTPENAVQNYAVSTGDGSLQAARGSVIVEVDGEAVTGEVDVTGQAIDESTAETLVAGVEDQQAELSGMSWSGMTWSGMSLVGHDLVRDVVVRHELVRHELVRHVLVRHELVGHVLVRDELDLKEVTTMAGGAVAAAPFAIVVLHRPAAPGH